MWNYGETNGRLISNTKFNANQEYTLDMTSYPVGLYFIRLTNNDETKVIRIMKVQ